MLTVYDSLPAGLLQCQAHELHTVLDGPSLIHLPGEKTQPLFVSVLLHGNETTGWEAVRQLLEFYSDKPLPRSLSLFIGNVTAAHAGLRHLAEQPDYNRIWKAEDDRPEAVMVRQILEEMNERQVYACVDIHNNSGHNPHYACVNRLDEDYLQLAGAFSRTVVYFLQPDTVLSLAFSRLCPATTVECGKPTERSGVMHAYEYISQLLLIDNLQQLDNESIDLFHTVAVMKLRPGVVIGINDQDATMSVSDDIDQYNFIELRPGTCLARLNQDSFNPLLVVDEHGEDVTTRFLDAKDDGIYTRTAVMPSMLTLDLDIIRQDCFGYLLERMPSR